MFFRAPIQRILSDFFLFDFVVFAKHAARRNVNVFFSEIFVCCCCLLARFSCVSKQQRKTEEVLVLLPINSYCEFAWILNCGNLSINIPTDRAIKVVVIYIWDFCFIPTLLDEVGDLWEFESSLLPYGIACGNIIQCAKLVILDVNGKRHNLNVHNNIMWFNG